MGTKIQVDAKSVKEELVYKLLQELDFYRSLGPDNIHLRVLRELSGTIAGPLSIILEESWRSGDVPEDWKKANVTPIYQKDLKKDTGGYWLINLPSVCRNVMEQILLGFITSQVKHMIVKKQHRFTRGKSCLTNLSAFYNNCSVDAE